MKLLIVSETLNEGGAELFVLRLARRLLRSGIDVTVLNMNEAYENKTMTAGFAELPILRMKMPFVKALDKIDEWLMRLGIDRSLKYFFQSRILTKKFSRQYDIIHTNYSRVDHLFAKLKKKNNLFRQVVTVHGDYSDQYYRSEKGEMTGWLHPKKKIKLITEAVDEIVVVSEEQRLFFTTEFNVPSGKIQKIYNGFEPPEQTGGVEQKKNDVFTFGMMARGAAQKGWQLLIDAFLKMPAGTKLLLVGGGEYLDQLKEKYKKNDRIIFAGFQPQPLQWISQMDVFVLPTLYPYESLPTVVTEALYCGIPVVATNVGEIERMITDERTGKKAGFVIDLNGKVFNEAALYEKLKYLYENPGARDEMSGTAKNAFLKFEMKDCIDQYVELYERLLQ